MRNIWLITKREYLERVRTKAFVLSTLLIPALMFGFSVLPAKLAGMKAGTKKIAVVVSDPRTGQLIQEQLVSPTPITDRAGTYQVTIDLQATDANRKSLEQRVRDREFDSFIWATDDALRDHKVTYFTRSSSDFVERSAMRNALRAAVMKARLTQQGVSAAELDELMKPVELDLIDATRGKTGDTDAAFFVTFMLVLALYMTVLMYGVNVMRAVLEEKQSRVVEVMLASCTPRDLMAGKILGVGAVGLTQVLIWSLMGGLAALPGVVIAGATMKMSLPLPMMIWFAVFFLLGFLLYSAMSAALGAMVNSEQEAQQMQFIIIMPMVIAMMLIMLVVRQPNSPAALWGSMIPFTAPLIMFLRMSVGSVPAWQTALCLAILLATIYAVLLLSSRIYRVGILMYGKRPTLPEILKWIRYA